MFQDRLHWFGKRLTCSCYVAYVKFSHNVTFYEQIQIWLSSTKSSYCRSIIVNLIQTFLRTCGEVLIEKYFQVFVSSQNSWWKTSWKLGNLCLLLIESIKQPLLLDNLKSILGLSTLTLLYRIVSCRNDESIDNENAFKLEKNIMTYLHCILC